MLMLSLEKISELLGKESDTLLQHQSKTISKDLLHLPGPDTVNKIYQPSSRNP